MDIPKSKRLQEFLSRLASASPVNSHAEALLLVAQILNDVENEFTSIPYNPSAWHEDNRMYPPQPDNARDEGEGLTRYRSKGHNTLIHSSGAIRLDTIGGICLLNKAAQNGHFI